MPKRITKPDVNGQLTRELTIVQENAIDQLVAGATDAEAAAAVGVTRQSIGRWRHRDVVFIAALNKRRGDVWSGSVDRLRALVPKALATLETALGEGMPRVAMRIVELAGLGCRGSALAHLGAGIGRLTRWKCSTRRSGGGVPIRCASLSMVTSMIGSGSMSCGRPRPRSRAPSNW